MKVLTPTYKGIVTGVVMAIAFLIMAYNPALQKPFLQYIIYFIYGLGMVWAITGKPDNTMTFGAFFNKGFRCFVVATLIIAVTIFLFYKLNPAIVAQSAELTKQELLKTQKNRTPAEIDEIVKRGKENYAVMALSVTIFTYLFIGAVVSAAAAGILSLYKKQ